jgi:hypothetical protein
VHADCAGRAPVGDGQDRRGKAQGVAEAEMHIEMEAVDALGRPA